MDGLSNNIRKLRFDNGQMTQRQLAQRVGISRQTMNAIENGHHAPRIDVAIRIADVFRTSVDRLFEFNYDGKPDTAPVSVECTVEPEEIDAQRPVENVDSRASTENGDNSAAARKGMNQTTRAMLRGLLGS